MTNKPLIAGLARVAAMAAVLWSMPAAADRGSAASYPVYQAHDYPVYQAHDYPVHQAHDRWPDARWPDDRWPGDVRQADTCPNPDDMNGPDGDHDCDDPIVPAPPPRVAAPEPGTLALLALGLGGIGLGRIRRRGRT
jgi:hypothetical protein